MSGARNWLAVRDGASLDAQVFCNFQITPSLSHPQRRAAAVHETQISDKASARLVRQIGPDDIVKDVLLEGVYCGRKPGEPLRSRPGAWKTSRVDDEAGDVVEVRMSEEIRIDERAGNVGGVLTCEARVHLQACKRPSLNGMRQRYRSDVVW